jgi:EAL domain-containing protein (putative c-di-GMP-specific phosphodiesterase class I)
MGEEEELQFCSLKIDESYCENIHKSGADVEIVNNSNELFKLEINIL